MPIYTRDTLRTERLPWVEIDDFEFFVLGRPAAHTRPATADSNGQTAFWGTYEVAPDPVTLQLERTAPHERLMVLSGDVLVESDYGRHTMRRRDWIELPATGARVTNVGTSTAELARIGGHWASVIRTEICLFRPDRPCDYHYHDGDEYWFVFRGHFTLNYDDREYAMRPGLMLAAGMGYEHGSLHPEEQFEAVVFATKLEGERRDGHLTRERHGAPVRNRDVPPAAQRAFELGVG
jgi:mannose-6-phosphate isomerase-like protein (cupin superfamily)